MAALLLALLSFILAACPSTADDNSGGRDCAKSFAQCGGKNFNGPVCCVPGQVCVYRDEAFSQCRPKSNYYSARSSTARSSTTSSWTTRTNRRERTATTTTQSTAAPCGKPYDQCGGKGFTGPTCCTVNYNCYFRDELYSQCRPDQPLARTLPVCNGTQNKLWDQCRGTGYVGPQCCPNGTACVYTSPNYAQCVPGDYGQRPTTTTSTSSTWSTLSGSGSSTTSTTTATRRTTTTTPTTTTTTTEEVTVDECAKPTEQCGGISFKGPYCCTPPSYCQVQDQYVSKCVFDRPSPSPCNKKVYWSQCGGAGFTGLRCCPDGSRCVISNPMYSHCVPTGGTTTWWS